MRLLIHLSIIGGIVLIIFGAMDYRISLNARETPQKITCKDLLNKGAGNNLHVIVTDFKLRRDAFVVAGRDLSAQWDTAYIPVVSAHSTTGQQGTTFGLILQSPKVRQLDDVDAIQESGQLHGTIVNSITSINSKARELLEKHYPGTNFDTCLILAHDKTPVPVSVGLWKMGGGAGLVVLCFGASLLGVGANQRRRAPKYASAEF